MAWSQLSANEIERRRKESVAALKARDAEDFESWYQEECDRLYWAQGQCCAGCDFWRSDCGDMGRCSAAGIVSGADVIRSMGCDFSSYTPPPGFPYTRADHWCGKFCDDFDWWSLNPDYLSRIGAVEKLRLGRKPNSPNKE